MPIRDVFQCLSKYYILAGHLEGLSANASQLAFTPLTAQLCWTCTACVAWVGCSTACHGHALHADTDDACV